MSSVKENIVIAVLRDLADNYDKPELLGAIIEIQAHTEEGKQLVEMYSKQIIEALSEKGN